MPSASGHTPGVSIGRAEAGQNLRRFLQRRLGLPAGMLYRWMRSGQIRVNSKRCQGDMLLAEGDFVRLPPQAAALACMNGRDLQGQQLGICTPDQKKLGADLPIVHQDENLLVLNKPSGLAVHGGSGQHDSVTRRLRLACPADAFVPAPAHRLDKPASGLLLAGKTQTVLRRLHALFKATQIDKDYLCWARGDFTLHAQAGVTKEGAILEDMLHLSGFKDREGHEEERIQPAVSVCYFLDTYHHPHMGVLSLLRVRLLTGRKHQIRRQLSGRGFPLVGDQRYNGPPFPRLLLHAVRLRLPDMPGLELNCPPDWPEPFQTDRQRLI
ncbi:MAG: RluA family pseudouridine synthase [Deltaproteobacteria bacterium]|jgi:23S rRNA pseudouridine955/2504/2580 synthase|nr:RluA family pseudouridine synthase [Deltaproteobacteria bacterium]